MQESPQSDSNPSKVRRALWGDFEIHGEEVTPRVESPRPGDVRHSHADISAASKALGWAPAVSLEEGLRRTMESLSEGASHAG